MKKKYKILIAFFLAVIVVLGIFIYINSDLILALKNGFLYSKEDLSKMKEENNYQAEETLKDYGIEQIRPLTEEEEQKLNSGEITEEEAVDIILGRTDKTGKGGAESSGGASSGNAVNNNGGSAANSGTELTQEEKAKIDEQIASLVGQIYVLKSRFTGELKGVEQWVLDQYVALSPEDREPKLSPAEQAIGKQMYSKVSALEDACDADVEGILSELTGLLKKSGQDTGLVSAIRESYKKEKQIMKSYYISTYR